MANDNFTDLTEPEGTDEAEKKKKEKEPKPQKPPKAELTKAEKKAVKKAKKGKKKGKKLKIILIIVLVLLVAGFVFEEVYINYLGTRDLLIDAVVKLDPNYGTRESKLDRREEELNTREANLDARERSAASKETQNERRGAELDAREEELMANRDQLRKPLYWLYMTEQEITDMQTLSKAYSSMAPDAAASILVRLDRPNDVAAILYYMNAKNSGAILAAMEPIFAATITEILLNN